jgi:hypothetical protein
VPPAAAAPPFAKKAKVEKAPPKEKVNIDEVKVPTFAELMERKRQQAEQGK